MTFLMPEMGMTLSSCEVCITRENVVFNDLSVFAGAGDSGYGNALFAAMALATGLAFNGCGGKTSRR